MNFNSLDEIVSHFELDDHDAEEVKKELKKLIKKVHPDRNHGDFKNEKDKELFMEIQAALEFLEGNVNTSLATKNDITALTKVLKDLAVTRKDEVVAESIAKKGSSLTTKLQDSITAFHKQNTTPKITSIVATTIITALWVFPSTVKDHPLLGALYHYNKEFTIVWLFSLFTMGLLWLRIKSSERRDEQIKRSYKLEATQNFIFSLFTKWMSANHRNFSIRDNKRVISFSKDDMISFLITRYNFFQRRLRGTENRHHFEIEKIIKDLEEGGIFDEDNRRRSPLYPFYRLTSFLPKPGEIDLEIAQLICDLIIDRLNAKGAIIKSATKSLSDIYEYEEEF